MATEGGSSQSPIVPKFDGDYDYWRLVMENLLRSKEYWQVIETGYTEPPEGTQLTAAQQKSLEEMKLKDLKARNYLFYSIDKSILKTITQKDTAKQLWDAMKTKYQGNTRVRRAQLQRLRREFETLEMKSGETVTEYFGRIMTTANDMRNCGEDMPDVKIVEKVLRTLTENFNFVVCSIEESKDLDTLSVDELQSSLLVHEQKLIRKENVDQALKVDDATTGRGRGRGRGTFSRGRGRGRGRGRSYFDKSTVDCYKCNEMGHFQYECPRWNKAANYAEFDENEELVLMVEEKAVEVTETWFLDSACSNHMTGNKSWFVSLDENIQHSVKLGNDVRLAVKGIGNVRFEVNGIVQTITNVYFVPALTSNLISIGQLQERGVKVVIENGECKVYHSQRVLIITSRMSENRMFVVQGNMKPLPTRCLQVGEENKTHIWHKRFAHVNHKAIRTMQYKRMVKGLPQICGKTIICETCNIGKQKRDMIPKSSAWRATEKLELVHTDLCGPIKPISQVAKGT